LIINKIILSYKTLFLVVFTLQLHGINVAYADEAESAVAPDLVPDSISNTYSDIDMRLRLAAKPNAAPCVAENCNLYQEFDARVKELGAQLSVAAYEMYPTLQKRVPIFNFTVIDKLEPGTASNGAGSVVVFRGVQGLQLNDEALGFVLAREMGHVIGKHHVTNTSTKLIISALASVLFPAVAIIGASSAAAQASTATTLLTSAASTATSMVGSEVALSKMKPNQLVESDEIALKLSNHQEWDMRSTANILLLDEPTPNGWIQDLQVSAAYLQNIIEEEDLAILPLEDADFIAETEPTIETGSTFEDVDLTTDEQNLPVIEVDVDAPTESDTETGAEVTVQAIQ
jgi:hypothetical protein